MLTLLACRVPDTLSPEKFHEGLTTIPSQADRDAVTRYKFDSDRRLALVSQLIRRHYFSTYCHQSWAGLVFDRHPDGKPRLQGQPDFNISHHGNWVAFVAAKEDTMKVGIDLVSIDAVPDVRSFVTSFREQLAPEELAMILQQPTEETMLRAFYTVWGLKESYVKAIGVGLYLDLARLRFDSQDGKIVLLIDNEIQRQWRFHLSWLDGMTLAVVCYAANMDLDPPSQPFLGGSHQSSPFTMVDIDLLI
ncbi:4'-phosphopantetheinyl transferase superfamily [Syncephalastrum racemosum]|uniref:holo-[acyl-carrier-protein] synthase n=1 Tax=Syncephalastrum racemosum TaxID=13706 RepID=A0A1X2H8X6_SYNRA|nr:4'-phosphopantetheinyl transferase superfamily [Syncephalastrum racemosum]